MYSFFFCNYGTITGLAQRYNVSRQFIYDLKNELNIFCENQEKRIKSNSYYKLFKSYESALSLRMEGKSSINSISILMKRQYIPYSSVGAISEHLKKAGSLLDNTISSTDGVEFVIFAADEIYSKRHPILITCDPVSFTILNIKLCEVCTSEEWEAQWKKLKAKGIIPLFITKDEGTEMKSACKKEFPNIDIQSDTYHGVAHKLGVWHKRLIAYSYKKIEDEYKKENLFLKSKTNEIYQKRKLEYQQAKKKSIYALDILDDFEFIYYNLLSCFELFDCNGELKNKKEVMKNFETALELGIECIKYDTIKKQLHSIKKIKHKLFNFYDIAKNILKELIKNTDSFVLNHICLYWQTHKRWIKTKDSKIKNRIKIRENKQLADIQTLVSDDFKQLTDLIVKKLNRIVQSSSAVECINSILRPYLNTCKNQPTQEFLNLFMFYHNHKCFKAGERKGYTPMELFTGKKQNQDWLNILMNKLKKKI